jgi:predicted acyltransferase
VVLLAALAAIYKGGGEELSWMKIHWWGILGLIGWAYLFSALVYFFSKGQLLWIIVALAAVILLNLLEVVPNGGGFRLVVSASNHILVMTGVLASVIFHSTHTQAGNPDPLTLQKGNDRFITAFSGGSQKIGGPVKPGESDLPGSVATPPVARKGSAMKGYRSYFFILLALGAAALIYGFLVRPLGGISKIHATPSWTMICAGISLLVLALLYLLTDRMKITSWAKIIAPAGRSTLTCYLIPYVVYPLLSLLHFKLPAALTTGIVGLIKSLLFALLIVALTRLFEKMKITLKI